MANCRTITAKLRAEGLPLELVNASADGYFYFIFVVEEPILIFETRSVYVCHFRDLTEAQWLEEGRDFAASVKEAVA